jgi:molecular chaperone HscB
VEQRTASCRGASSRSVRGGSETERRQALAKAVEVNEAWRIVRDPMRRAEALLELGGEPSVRTVSPRRIPPS